MSESPETIRNLELLNSKLNDSKENELEQEEAPQKKQKIEIIEQLDQVHLPLYYPPATEESHEYPFYYPSTHDSCPDYPPYFAPATISKPTISSKPNNQNVKINLIIDSGDGTTEPFTVFKTTPLRYLFLAYEDKLARSKTIFFFNNVRIKNYSTPELLEMQDGDIIYVK